MLAPVQRRLYGADHRIGQGKDWNGPPPKNAPAPALPWAGAFFAFWPKNSLVTRLTPSPPGCRMGTVIRILLLAGSLGGLAIHGVLSAMTAAIKHDERRRSQ